MKLMLTDLRKYTKLLSSIGDKGKQTYESFLLDTKNSRLVFFAENYTGQIALKIEKDPATDKEDLFFISKATFLTLIKTYSELTLVDRKFVSNDGEYELAAFEDDVGIPDFRSALPEKFAIPIGLSSRIHDAIDFADENAGVLNGIFFHKGHIVGTDRNQLYDYIFDPSEPDSKLYIPLMFMKIYDLLPTEGDATFYQNHKTIRLNYKDEFIVQMGRNVDLSPPDVTDTDFQALFAHENYLEMEKTVLADLVAFMKTFVQDAPSKRMKVIFSEGNLLTLEALDFSKAKRSIAVEFSDPEYFAGKEFWISADAVERILKKIATPKVRIRINFDAPTVDFFVDSTYHIVCTRILED